MFAYSRLIPCGHVSTVIIVSFFLFYSIDATDEPSTGPVLGRLVNHGEKNEVNVKLKSIDNGGVPALCFLL